MSHSSVFDPSSPQLPTDPPGTRAAAPLMGLPLILLHCEVFVSPSPASSLPRAFSWLYLDVSSFLVVPVPASMLTAPPGGVTHATPTAACAHLPWLLPPASTPSWSGPCTCRVTFSLPDPTAAWISAGRAGGVLVTAPSVPPVSSAAWRILLRAGGSLRRHRRFISVRVIVRGILLGAGRGHTSHVATEASGSGNPALTIRPAVSDGAGADGRVLVILSPDCVVGRTRAIRLAKQTLAAAWVSAGERNSGGSRKASRARCASTPISGATCENPASLVPARGGCMGGRMGGHAWSPTKMLRAVRLWPPAGWRARSGGLA